MKKPLLAAGLIVVMGSGLVGCKSTPKLAFWKKDAAPDSTALASAAPALPSDLAKQGAAAPTTVAQSRMTEAAPFVPGQVARTATTTASPASYPSTDAPPFTPDVANRIASSATPAPSTSMPAVPSSPAPSSNLGSIAAAPYNPSAPPAPTTPQIAATPSAGDSRYGGAAAPSAPLYGQPPIGSMAATPGSTATPPASTNSLADAPVFGAPMSGDRYGSAPAPGANQTGDTGAVANVSAAIPVTPGSSPQVATPAVATTAQAYRPGGTSTYASGPAALIASRPQETLSAPSTSGTTVPNVARPGNTGVTTPAATTPTTTQGRYW